MPINYNFKENWYEVIVPLLNTPKVKNAIKKGLLGYMNNDINPDVKFKSYKNIYDYLNNKHGPKYFNKNSAPADLSSFSLDYEMDWEHKLIATLERHNMIKPFPWDNYDGEKQKNTNPELEYEEYREYLNPILKPFIDNYKKTHMNSYCLWCGCDWWNPTFCLTLAKIVMPNEKWRVKSMGYHTTIVNSDNTKIFDILEFDEDDSISFGGNEAYECASMTLDEIRERNIKNNRIELESTVNNCDYDEIYDPTFNQLYTDLDDIEKNITKMETTLEGLTGMFLNKTYNDEEKDFRIFEFQQKIIDELFPNVKFSICIDFNDLNKVVTTKKKATLIQTFDCYCYDTSPVPTKTFIIKSNKPMTRRYIINELIKQDFTLDCNHCFLESLEVNSKGIIEWYGGS